MQEMQENMEGVRTVWSMQLDAGRNRLILIELKVAIASLAVMVMTVPGEAGSIERWPVLGALEKCGRSGGAGVHALLLRHVARLPDPGCALQGACLA